MTQKTQKKWFITGAGSGLGYLLTAQLLAKGDCVAATTRQNFDALNQLKIQYGDQLWLAPLDITDIHTIAQVVEAAFEYFKTIDVVVSNAGHVLLGALEEVALDQITAQINTNLMGPIVLLKTFIPYLRHQGAGRILQLSSEAGQMTYPALSLYHASKWGIEGFCESLAREVAVFNIHITLIEPGRIQTTFDRNAVMPQQIHPAYQKTTVGNYRRLLAMGKFPNIGAAQKVVKELMYVAQRADPPIRLTLGSDAYINIHRALTARLQVLETQKNQAYSTDKIKEDELDH